MDEKKKKRKYKKPEVSEACHNAVMFFTVIGFDLRVVMCACVAFKKKEREGKFLTKE